MALPHVVEKHLKLDLYYDEHVGLKAAIENLCDTADAAVRGGAILLLLSDRYPVPGLLPINAPLAVGAVHARRTQAQLPGDCTLVVDRQRATASFRLPDRVRRDCVCPYLSYQTLFDMNRRGELKGREGEAPSEIGRSYRRGIRKGLLKIISKMGISTIAGYRGAQLFEIVGLDRDVVELCFPGTPSRIGGAGFDEIEAEYRAQLAAARDPNYALPPGGLLHALPDGEYHIYNPAVVGSLQAVRTAM